MQGESCLRRTTGSKTQQKEAKEKRALLAACAMHYLRIVHAHRLPCPSRPSNVSLCCGSGCDKSTFCVPRFLFSRLNEQTLTPAWPATICASREMSRGDPNIESSPRVRPPNLNHTARILRPFSSLALETDAVSPPALPDLMPPPERHSPVGYSQPTSSLSPFLVLDPIRTGPD